MNGGRTLGMNSWLGALWERFLALEWGMLLLGRYAERGWIFTVGEMAAIGMFIKGAVDMENASSAYFHRHFSDNRYAPEPQVSGLLVGGLLGLMGLRLWEVIDVWVTPANYNRRYDQIKRKVNPNGSGGSTPRFFLAPVAQNSPGFSAGVQFRF